MRDFVLVLAVITIICLNARAGVQEDFLHCVRTGDYSRVASLLKKYPKLAKAKTATGDSALHVAAAHGRIKVAELLLRNGAEINAKAKYDYTPLDYAVLKKQHAMMRWLLERGADVNNPTSISRSTPLFTAAALNDPIAAQILIAKGASVNHQSAMGTALHEAARWRSFSVAKVLLEAGASVGARAPETGKTPLHCAAHSQALDVARLLIEHGAKIGETDSRGRTPLHDACELGPTPQFIRWFLDKGANPNARDKFGNTPLHVLAAESYRALLELEAIARKSSPPPRGKAPFQRIKHERIRDAVDCVRLLLTHGADPSARNLAGQTPMDVAREVGFTEMVNVLQEHKKVQGN